MDMEKVIKETEDGIAFAESRGFGGLANTMRDALALLKEQKAARVMTLDELKEIYVEFILDNCPIRLTNFDLQKIILYVEDGICRLWTGKPTDEQRKAVKWE